MNLREVFEESDYIPTPHGMIRGRWSMVEVPYPEEGPPNGMCNGFETNCASGEFEV
jgi:hypothetical protein